MGLVDHNPVVGTLKLGDEVKRDHVISNPELVAIWISLGATDYGRIVRLLLLTGQRRDEVGSMQWPEIDLERSIWTIPSARTKNARAHEVPLSTQATSVLRATPRIVGRDFVFGSGQGGFSGWSKSKRELDMLVQKTLHMLVKEKHEVLRPWRLHDLRRTAATGMATLGTSPHVVEAVLNHVSGSRAGVAGVYNLATYKEEKRVALSNWGRHIESLIERQ